MKQIYIIIITKKKNEMKCLICSLYKDSNCECVLCISVLVQVFFCLFSCSFRVIIIIIIIIRIRIILSNQTMINVKINFYYI